MRRIAVAIGMIVVIGLVGSCGSSDDKSSDTTSKASTKPPSVQQSSLTSVSAVKSKLKSKGIDCAGKPVKPAALFGVQAKEAETCKIDGAEVRISVYGSNADRSRFQGFVPSIACSTNGGKSSSYVSAGNWLLSADFKAENSIEVNEKLGTALGTKPIAVKC